jgi:N-terminal acetyltransferase B complex non-catalytic subunit
MDATFLGGSSDEDAESEADRQELLDRVSRTRDLFTRLAALDGKKDRTAFLAVLELEKRARVHGLSHGQRAACFTEFALTYARQEPQLLVDSMERYFKRFGDKTCCFEDIKPYLSLDDSEMPRWVQFLTSVTPSVSRSLLIISAISLISGDQAYLFSGRFASLHKYPKTVKTQVTTLGD